MAIFRGDGGAGDSNTDSTLTLVTAQAVIATTKASASAASASGASTSASTATTKANESAASATAAANSATSGASTATASANSATASANSATASANSATAAASSASSASSTLSGAAVKANNLSDLVSASTARSNRGLGTVATTAANAYATATQGPKADNALVASTVSTYGASLIDDANAGAARTTLGLGTVATTAANAYATATQGTKADNALVASTVSTYGASLIDDANAGAARTTLGLGTAAVTATGAYATATQGTKADNALVASTVSSYGATLIDDANAAAARTTLGLGDVATTAASAYATASQGAKADSALQSNSTLNADNMTSGTLLGGTY